MLVDDVIMSKDFLRLRWLGQLLAVVYCTSAIANYLTKYLSERLAAASTRDLRNEVFVRLQYARLNSIAKFRTGDLLTRLTNDVRSLQSLFISGALGFIGSTSLLVTIVGILIHLNTDLTLLVLPVIPLYVVIGSWIGREVKRMQIRALSKLAVVTSISENSLNSLLVSRIFHMGEWWRLRLSAVAEDLYRARIAVGRWEALASAGVNLCGSAIPMVLLWYGGHLVLSGRMTLGALVAFSGYITRLFGPVNAYVGIWLSVQSTLASWDRVRVLLELDTEETAGLPIEVEAGQVRFSNVTFGYTPGEPVFKDFSAVFTRRRINIVVGPSGSGKTSIVNLLAKLYEPWSGEITIDDTPLSRISPRAVRACLAVVPQEEFLVDASIYDNIALGKPSATRDEVVASAQQARAHDFICELRRGYDTVLKDEGASLSGGQKQRIALARALIRGAPILILDEATSQVDPESERIIYEVLDRLKDEVTVIAIAHHPPSVTGAIFVKLSG